MMSDENKELIQQRRSKRNKARMELERQQKRERQLKRAEREKEKARKELAAMNNEVTQTDKVKKIREKFERKAKSTIGMSKENQTWEQVRKNRYNQKVWKGWREK